MFLRQLQISELGKRVREILRVQTGLKCGWQLLPRAPTEFKTLNYPGPKCGYVTHTPNDKRGGTREGASWRSSLEEVEGVNHEACSRTRQEGFQRGTALQFSVMQTHSAGQALSPADRVRVSKLCSISRPLGGPNVGGMSGDGRADPRGHFQTTNLE